MSDEAHGDKPFLEIFTYLFTLYNISETVLSKIWCRLSFPVLGSVEIDFEGCYVFKIGDIETNEQDREILGFIVKNF